MKKLLSRNENQIDDDEYRSTSVVTFKGDLDRAIYDNEYLSASTMAVTSKGDLDSNVKVRSLRS